MLNRRELLQYGALTSGMLPASVVLATESPLSCHYSGPGLYLYPAWGAPRPYLLQADSTANTVQFCDPYSKRLLWIQSSELLEGLASKLTTI